MCVYVVRHNLCVNNAISNSMIIVIINSPGEQNNRNKRERECPLTYSTNIVFIFFFFFFCPTSPMFCLLVYLPTKYKWPRTPCSPDGVPSTSRTRYWPLAIAHPRTNPNSNAGTSWTNLQATRAMASDNCPVSVPGAGVSLRPSADSAA